MECCICCVDNALGGRVVKEVSTTVVGVIADEDTALCVRRKRSIVLEWNCYERSAAKDAEA